METVNDVIRVFDTAGNPLTGVVDQNSFYGYAPAIVRPSTFGPFVTDPSCLFDADTQRWFHVVLTLDRVGTTAAFSGTNHLDLASREVLESALAGFPGTIVFISHDRYFINRIATKVVEVAAGQLTPHLGDYDDYLTAKEHTEPEAPPAATPARRQPEREPEKVRRRRAPRTRPRWMPR